MTALPLSTRDAANDHRGLASRISFYAASGLSWTAALIHLWAAPEHLSEWWGYGIFFLIAALCQGAFAVLLLRWPGRRLALAGAAGNLALVSLYAVTRTAGIPFFGPHAGEIHAVGAIDAVCVAAELALVVILVARARVLPAAGRFLAIGALQAFGVGAALHLLHRGMHEAHGVGPVAHWLNGSAAMIPLSVLALWLATPLSRRLAALLYGEEAAAKAYAARAVWALTAAAAYAAFGAPAYGLAMQHPEAGSFLAQAGSDAGVTLGVAFLLLLAFAALRGTPWETPRAINLWRPRAMATGAGLAAGVFLVVGPSFFGSAFGDALNSPAGAQQAAGQCNAATSHDRSYDVAAINVDIPFNRWGDVDPDGQIYVLQQDKKAVENWSKPLEANPQNDPAGNRRLRPRPLVIRANAGECVKIDFTNELNDTQWGGRLVNPRASMQVRGPAYDAQTSDGGAVGYNKDTSVPNTPGQNKISYFWKAPTEEGLYLFRSQTMSSGEEEDAGSVAHGLYGALAVEPAGSTWTDPVSGKKLYSPDNAAGAAADPSRDTSGQSGELYIDADIHPAGGKSFRESAQLAQDYNEVQPGLVGHGFNYGTEPQRNREKPENLPPDGLGEEVSLSSWGYGDPALVKLASGPGPWKPERDAEGSPVTDPAEIEDCNPNDYAGFDSTSCFTSNVNHTYQNDPTKIRYAMAGVAETHVFHLHANQWLANPKETATFDPKNPKSATIDSQTFGPGETFTADLLYGAGSKPGTVGDSIFHCHLYPHFAEGFWSLMRVHDVREDGKNDTPDGINVRNLQPLPDRAAQAPPAADLNIDGNGTDNPGYPRFVPGEFGWRAPQAPESILEPDTTTANPDDKRDAMRIVAGEGLDPALTPDDPDPAKAEIAKKLQAETGAQKMLNPLQNPNPGAPFSEPCQAGAREVTYNVSVLQRDIVYNEDGWHDTQGRFLVLDKDVPKMLEKNADGTYKHQPEPLFARVNAGDCVNFNLTNLLPNWFGNDAFVKLIQTNMMGQHIHLVKFDVLASDGSTNGWNYQQAAFTKEQMEFNQRVLNDELKPGESCDRTNGCSLPNPDSANWNASWNGGIQPGQTIQERWYADYELRTVFSHDHHFAAVDQNRGQFAGLLVEPEKMNFRNPKTGEFFQPGNGNVPGAPNCGLSCEGDAVGSAMDVIGPEAKDDFREFGLAFQDFVSLTRKGGDPQNRSDVFVGPNEPEHYPDEDPGVVGINYRNAPFPIRQEKNGQPTDPAHVFSSTVHGDPETPILEAYSEDPVQVRLMQGSQEHQHVFDMHGVRWNEDPNNPKSPLVGSQDIGISEAFNFKVPKITCGANEETCAGDYLYSSPNVDDTYMGMWGLLRARAKEVDSLLPLPDNVPQAEGQAVTSRFAAGPPEANTPGTPCPTDAPSREFEVVALETELKYNKYGDHDPYGLIYALSEPGETPEQTVARVRAQKEHEPMVLRANQGDCISVRLHNELDPNGPFATQHAANGAADGDAMPPLEPATGTPAGLRVSLHPQLVKYDVRGSDGTAVGYNRDQTVAPDDSKVYRWYADQELGAINLTDFGDVRGHRHHGLFASLNIEPKGATYYDPQTGEAIRSGASADIRVPGPNNDFREFTLNFQDGLNLRDASGTPIANVEEPHVEVPGEPAEPAEPAVGEAHDHIDQGEKGFNYGNAPFHHRLGMEATLATPTSPIDGQKMAQVYSSKVHGDPDTPIFRAYAGDDIRMRVLQGADKQRQNVFEQLGHSWPLFPEDPNTNWVSAQGGFSVGRALNVHLPSAGNGSPGDYRYADGMYRHHLSGGMWGITRVYPKPSAKAALSPTPLRAVDNPLTLTNHPILPLEVFRTETKLSLNAQPDRLNSGQATKLIGKLVDAKRRPAANMPVVLMQKPEGSGSEFTRVATAKTRDTGAYTFAGVKVNRTTDYVVRFAGNIQKGLSPSASPVKRVIVKGA